MNSGERKLTAIRNGEIEIKPYKLSILKELCIEAKVNDHIYVYLVGELWNGDGEKRDQYAIEAAEKEKLEINAEVNGEMQNLFTGLVTNIQVSFANNVYSIKVEAVSATCNLDLKRENNSFQDQEMQYKEIFNKIKKSCQDSFKTELKLTDETTQNKKTGQFVIQYKETNWEFLKRLASHFHTVLLPNARTEHAEVSFGLPKSSKKAVTEEELENLCYRVRKRIGDFRSLHENDQEDQGRLEIDYICYEVESYLPLELGEKVKFKEKELLVYQVTAILRDDQLIFNYVLAAKKAFSQNRVYNQQLVGLSLEGEVLELKKDQVKIHLKIDKGQDKAKAYLFPYATPYTAEGNTGWYCMPEEKDWVNLYFPTCKEEDAFITTSNRTQTDERMHDPQVKYFRTPSGKEISFDAEQILITCNEGKTLIRLSEKVGIEIFSDQNIIISTSKDITMNASERILIQADQKIELVGGDNTSIKMENGVIHLKGSQLKTE